MFGEDAVGFSIALLYLDLLKLAAPPDEGAQIGKGEPNEKCAVDAKIELPNETNIFLSLQDEHVTLRENSTSS